MKQVIVFPRGQLGAKDKERMTKIGIVAVEADDPTKVVMLMPGSSLLVADDFLMSLFKGAMHDDYAKRDTMNELHKRMSLRERELASASGTPPEPASPKSP